MVLLQARGPRQCTWQVPGLWFCILSLPLMPTFLLKSSGLTIPDLGQGSRDGRGSPRVQERQLVDPEERSGSERLLFDEGDISATFS